jgi:hypothetical protein
MRNAYEQRLKPAVMQKRCPSQCSVSPVVWVRSNTSYKRKNNSATRREKKCPKRKNAAPFGTAFQPAV